MEKIRPLFIGQGEQLLAQAQQALAAGDYDQLWSSAHTLKGMSGSLGLATFSSLSRELEVLAEARAFHAATLQVEELVLAFGQVRQALERLRPA
jgi:HPt (histidine-containing phosphotransfer) domain-containing protein